jgi:hypothetical protein
MHPLKSHRYVSTEGPADHDDCPDLDAPPSSAGNKGGTAASGAATEPPWVSHGGPARMRDDIPPADRGTRHGDRSSED